ncbi:hypothetical protein K502DRAFT_326018 [Neoconidiobolus thromboides FSU 785]|nr:hypothetical protein K502DRAFT_326018 [Neoconidiobolus thromboides FSU 785]
MGISAGKSTISKHMKEFNFSFKCTDTATQNNNFVTLEIRSHYTNIFLGQITRFGGTDIFL